MTGEQLHLSPAESGDLYVAGVRSRGGQPIKIHVRRKAKSRYKPLRTGRKTPYGTQTKHHYMVLQCPYCFHLIVSLYRVRHTYKSLHTWLTWAFNLKRHFQFPLPNAVHLGWDKDKDIKCAISTAKGETRF